MKDLTSRTVSERYAFVKNGVIFKFAAYNKDNDKCAVKIDKESSPYFTVQEKTKENNEDKTKEVKLYLDSYLVVGDLYASGTFKKVIHGEEDEEKTLPEYFEYLCEKQLEESIFEKYDKDYEAFLKSYDDVPDYMVKQTTSTGYGITAVTGIEQINLTEEKFNEIKENKVKEAVLNSANSTAKIYGYKATDVTIEKLSDEEETEEPEEPVVEPTGGDEPTGENEG